MQIIIEIQDPAKALNFVQFLEQIPFIKIDKNVVPRKVKSSNYNHNQIQKFKGIVKNSPTSKSDWYYQ